MYIKSIEINGFKSYGNRTEIVGFDRLFNAITGLNGSGKSNILDSICFVLGISNLSQVRANNLHELVYKNGQAGISKASVSITFDNSDPTSSPLGYEQQREVTVTRIVVIGGRNKYLINGSVAQTHRVQDFFQSVHLNINNPHFLIMQGRITKVLNMKPHEILSMVEEAAGTRMYESKRESALNLMTKKEEKMIKIDTIISEEILPTLEKLKSERKDYFEYSRITRELEHYTKLHVAWKFTQAQSVCVSSKDDSTKKKEEMDNANKQIVDLKEKMVLVDTNVADLEKKKDEEAGNRLHVLEAELKQKQMDESKSNNILQNLKASLKDENKKIVELTKQGNEEKNTLNKRENDISKLQHNLEKLSQNCESDKKAVTDAEKQLHNVNAGLVKDAEGNAATIASQMMAAEEDMKRSETEGKIAATNLETLGKELKKKETTCTQMDDSYKSNELKYKTLQEETSNMKQEMERLGYEDGKAQAVKYEKETLERRVVQLKQTVDEMTSRFPQLSFDYKDPVPNFDRRKVYGPVCSLITVKDSAATMALELAAGSRLTNVVVQDDQTAKLLLDRGQLRHRCTFIPLNKIVTHAIPQNIVQKAENLVGRENVRTALSIIKYDPKLQAAMEFVFGGVFICSNMESAKRVTFNEGIRKMTVTLEGEVFDPAGTLSGGSMGQRSRLLTELSKLKSVEEEVKQKQHSLQGVSEELRKVTALAEKFQSLKGNFELKMSELAFLKDKIEMSTFHQQKKEVEDLKKSIAELKSTIEQCKETKSKAQKRYAELKSTDTKAARQQELKNAEKFLTNCQKQLASSESAFKKTQQQFEQAQLEAEELVKSIKNYEEQIELHGTNVQEIQRQLQTTTDELKEKKEIVEGLIADVRSQKAILKSHSQEIGKLVKDKEAMAREIENCLLHIQQLEHDIEKSDSDAKEAQKHVNHYLNKYEWIAEERKYFGVPNTGYDFTNYDAKAVSETLNKLEETKTKLSKCVNMRAQNMLTSAEKQFKDLTKKKKIVLEDKQYIQDVIKELDEKKKVTVKNACEKVNKDFGSIFSTLLPGAKAKLVPLENRDVLEGLEFKVGFGDTWKESLTELSGGQRSLVALSLILSMLLFKPAPIYILDEVDAALDLAHTQNIGQMLKTHFQKSQFIIVSLKDGMFDNANVLFKTKFVDGMSTVSRTTQKK